MRDYYSLILLILVVVAGLAYTVEVRAQEGDDDSAAITEVVEDPALDEDLMDPDAEVDTEEVIEDVGDLVAGIEAVKAAKGDKTAMFLAIMGLISAVLKLALDAVRKWGGVLTGKKGVRIACLVAGAVIFVTSYLAAGAEWYNALLLALAGPGAILVNELTKLIQTSKE
tara:strand:+ start:79 stop:585 length:507 start_codon:yes stop_codon:yes gene_type:complete